MTQKCQSKVHLGLESFILKDPRRVFRLMQVQLTTQLSQHTVSKDCTAFVGARHLIHICSGCCWPYELLWSEALAGTQRAQVRGVLSQCLWQVHISGTRVVNIIPNVSGVSLLYRCIYCRSTKGCVDLAIISLPISSLQSWLVAVCNPPQWKRYENYKLSGLSCKALKCDTG